MERTAYKPKTNKMLRATIGRLEELKQDLMIVEFHIKGARLDRLAALENLRKILKNSIYNLEAKLDDLA